MSFGLEDKDWAEPDERKPDGGLCIDCDLFVPCPCGCSWGECLEDGSHERYDGLDNGDGCDCWVPKERP